VWWGYNSAAERERIEMFLSRLQQIDLSNEFGEAAEMAELAEDGLLRSIIARETHMLRSLCPLLLLVIMT